MAPKNSWRVPGSIMAALTAASLTYYLVREYSQDGSKVLKALMTKPEEPMDIMTPGSFIRRVTNPIQKAIIMGMLSKHPQEADAYTLITDRASRTPPKKPMDMTPGSYTYRHTDVVYRLALMDKNPQYRDLVLEYNRQQSDGTSNKNVTCTVDLETDTLTFSTLEEDNEMLRDQNLNLIYNIAGFVNAIENMALYDDEVRERFGDVFETMVEQRLCDENAGELKRVLHSGLWRQNGGEWKRKEVEVEEEGLGGCVIM